MKIVSLAMLALMVGLITSARGADDKPAETPYYPLKIGKTWTYKSDDISLLMKVAKYEEIDGQRCARVEYSAGGSVRLVEHIAVKPDGRSVTELESFDRDK